MNIITIDVEDWYHSSIDLFRDSDVKHGAKPEPSVVKNTLNCLELLKKTENFATFFILGTVAEYYPDLIKEILIQNHEVACHGYLHKLIYKMSKQEFEYDLKKSLDLLDKAGASDILGFRAPYWSITNKSLWALEVILKCGFKYDSSIFPIRRKLYGIPNAKTKLYQPLPGLWEFPPATFRFLRQNIPIAGGGYLRLMPYFFVDSAIKNTNYDDYLVFYFHPYELDPEDVGIKHKISTISSLYNWIQQIEGRKKNPEKIIRLLKSTKFTNIAHVLSRFSGGLTY